MSDKNNSFGPERAFDAVVKNVLPDVTVYST